MIKNVAIIRIALTVIYFSGCVEDRDEKNTSDENTDYRQAWVGTWIDYHDSGYRQYFYRDGTCKRLKVKTSSVVWHGTYSVTEKRFKLIYSNPAGTSSVRQGSWQLNILGWLVLYPDTPSGLPQRDLAWGYMKVVEYD